MGNGEGLTGGNWERDKGWKLGKAKQWEMGKG